MDWFDRVPKVEMHLHLEGAVPHDTLWELVQKYGGDPAVPNLEALKRLFEYRDFRHFVEVWDWKNRFIREYADFTVIAETAARNWVRQNLRYVEAFFSPSDFACHGLKTQELTAAIRAGLSQVPDVEVALVADLVRDSGPEHAAITLAKVNEVRDLGVVGIGIGGSEHRFPPEPFAGLYEQARRLGLHTSAHAGEAAGPASIWGAIRSLHVDRIGHGTRACEDDRLVDYLAKTGTPLEVCPLSNVRTGVVKRLEEHPVRAYCQRGIAVTINTDDPQMFGNSLAEEYRLLEKRLGFSRDETRALILQGIRASWLSDDRKERMIGEFVHHPAWQDDAREQQ